MWVDEKIAFLDQYLGISQKWYNIWSQLLWVSKRKSLVFYCNMSLLLTLSDLSNSFLQTWTNILCFTHGGCSGFYYMNRLS